MFKFEELRVYQKALGFYLLIYSIANNWPQQFRYNLSDQLLRASLSIALNIAEGSGRTKNDFKHFLSISRGSCYECIPIITLAYKLKLLSLKEKEMIYNELSSMAKMLTSLKNSL